jgi:hypothetical protein
MFRAFTLAALVAATTLPALAQSADAQKQQLAQKIVTLWKPELLVMTMVQRPAVEAVQQSKIKLQGTIDDAKLNATMAAIQKDAQSFVDQVTPIALASAQKADTDLVVPMLVKEFSVEELQQIVALLESPVRAKFDGFMPRAQKAIGDRVAADAGPKINPKLKELTESVGTKLRHAAGQ